MKPIQQSIEEHIQKSSVKGGSLESDIHEACFNNDDEKVTILLSNKAREIDTHQLNRDGSLLIAIANENVKIVGELLKIGCNPNVTNEMKDSALFIAFINGNIQIINLLLQYRANIGDALILASSTQGSRFQKISNLWR